MPVEMEEEEEKQPVDEVDWSVRKLQELEQDTVGFKLRKSKPGVNVYSKPDESGNGLPYGRFEFQSTRCYPDQIYNLFSDEYILR